MKILDVRKKNNNFFELVIDNPTNVVECTEIWMICDESEEAIYFVGDKNPTYLFLQQISMEYYMSGNHIERLAVYGLFSLPEELLNKFFKDFSTIKEIKKILKHHLALSSKVKIFY